MIAKKINIGDGINVNYIHTDKFKTNQISVNFITQMNKDTAYLNAMIPVILLRGCRKYPTQAELNRYLQYLYSADIDAKNDKIGEFQVFGLSSNMLNDRFTGDIKMAEEMAQLLCDIIFDPYLENGVFSEKYVESEKINQIDLIESEINNKTGYSVNKCIEAMCKDEVFAVKKYGTVEDVEGITEASLYEAYLNALKSCKIEIYITGECDIEKISAIFDSYVKDIERDVKLPLRYPIVRIANEVKRIEEKQDVNQGKLCIGFRTGCNIEDENYHVVRLFSEIFGSGDVSKLFMNVREKMSLCYSIDSILFQRIGILMVTAGIEFENKEIAEKAIFDQLDAIKRGEITDEELLSAKRSLRNVFMQVYDSPRAMEKWTVSRTLSDKGLDPMDECKKIEGTTAEQVVELANSITLDTVYFLKGEDANG